MVLSSPLFITVTVFSLPRCFGIDHPKLLVADKLSVLGVVKALPLAEFHMAVVTANTRFSENVSFIFCHNFTSCIYLVTYHSQTIPTPLLKSGADVFQQIHILWEILVTARAMEHLLQPTLNNVKGYSGHVLF